MKLPTISFYLTERIIEDRKNARKNFTAEAQRTQRKRWKKIRGKNCNT